MPSVINARGAVGVARGRSLTRTQRCLGCVGHAADICRKWSSLDIRIIRVILISHISSSALHRWPQQTECVQPSHKLPASSHRWLQDPASPSTSSVPLVY